MSTSKIASKSYFLYFSVFSINLLSLSCGGALAWSSPALPVLKRYFKTLNIDVTPKEETLMASLISLGALIGPLIAATLADKIGRRKTVILTAIPITISYAIISVAKEVWLIYLARILAGFSCGASFAIVPNYVAEISDKHNRGALSTFMVVAITLGILLMFSITPFLDLTTSSLIFVLPTLIFIFLAILYVPESPHFLLVQNNEEEATRMLQKLRGNNLDQDVMEIKTNITTTSHTIPEILKNKVFLKRLFITVSLISFQQFSGINAILFYMQSIFEEVGSSLTPELSAIIIALVQFTASYFSSVLIDKAGRRSLMLLSSFGCLIALLAVGSFFYIKSQGGNYLDITWLPVLSLVVFIISYSLGLAPVPFTILGEIFPQHFKAMASIITIMICFFFSFITTCFFPPLNELIGIGPSFWIFAGFCFISVLFTYFLVPETKGKSFNEIEELFR